MKSISVGKLRDLEKEGWKITPSDKNAVSAQLRANEAATQIVKSLESIRDSIVNIVKMIPEENSDKIEKILQKHYDMMVAIVASQQKEEVRTWEFDVKRNAKGFIDRVVANGR